MPLAFPLGTRVENRRAPGLYGTVSRMPLTVEASVSWRWVRWDNTVRESFEQIDHLVDTGHTAGFPGRLPYTRRHV